MGRGWAVGLRDRYSREVEEGIGGEYMVARDWRKEKLGGRVGGLKWGTAAGRDWIRGETVQGLLEEGQCRKVLVEGINGIIGDRQAPSSWKVGNMKLVEKCGKPTRGGF